MNHKSILFLSVILFAKSIPCISAQYNPQELFAISWGDMQNQMKISMPTYEDVNFTPEDSSDDFIGTAGPRQGFVDKCEKIYLSSQAFMQLKGFDNSGQLLFDYSEGQPEYDPELFKTNLNSIYVDSLGKIYIVDGMRYDYVAVVDTTGQLLDKLSPYGVGSGNIVFNIYPNSNDVLTIGCKNHTYHTFENDVITDGGDAGWKALNGLYYAARLENSSKIVFVSYRNPDIYGNPDSSQEIFVSITGPAPYSLNFLGIDNQMNLYIYLIGPTPSDGRIQVYDSSFNILNEINLPSKPNIFMWYMTPYMRPTDGNIYEFRCEDDGLHVIKWSRQ